MKRCTRCILPETVPGITFDADGVCRFCRERLPISYHGEEPLLELFAAAREQGRPYDAVVPLSGGRDSSFILHYAVTHGLKVLAVNYDNEFVTDLAVANMQRVCRKLGTDLVRYRSRHGLARRIVRDSILNASRHDLPTLAQCFCGACSYGFRAVVYETARRHGIPLILWGGSRIEETTHMTRQGLATGRRTVAGLVGKLRPVNVRSRVNMYRLRWEFPSGRSFVEDLRLERPLPASPGITEVSVFDYIGWDRQLLKRTILDELGWRKPEGAATTWRSDCKLEPLVTYCFKNIFGCDKSAFGFHNMINEGQMTRAEALQREEATTGAYTPELDRLLREEIGLPEKPIARIRSFARPELWS